MNTKNGFFGFNPKAVLFWGLCITSGIMLDHHDFWGAGIFGALALLAFRYA
jgi:hypothetical protein